MSMTQDQIDALVKGMYGANALASASNPQLPQAQANALVNANSEIGVLNTNLATNFYDEFSNWAALVLAGKIPNTDPPRPPIGFMVVVSSNGWAWIVPGTDPVAPMPPIPVVPTPGPSGVVAIGVHLSGNFWQALPQDTAAAGYQTPSSVTTKDGANGIFKRDMSPFGGWWEKVG